MARTALRAFRLAGLMLLLLASPWFISQSMGAAAQPQYGGIVRIIDVAEGGQPIGVPWETSGIDTKLQKPYLESLLREDVKGVIIRGWQRHGRLTWPRIASPSPFGRG